MLGQTTGSSNVTKSSKSSRLPAACVEAEAERAALSAKIQSLEQKHALDMEQAQLKAKQEKLALATKLAAAEARAKLLRQSGSRRSDMSQYSTTSGSSAAVTVKLSSKAARKSRRPPMKIEPVDTPIGSAPIEVNALADVLKRQNEITELLVKQQITSLLPNREIPIFDGDPLQFHSFIRAFQQGVVSKRDNMQDKLNYLEQFTSGQPR